MKTGGINHLKTKRLKTLLGVPLYQAVGVLETLWHLTSECAWEFGDIGRYTDEEIASAIEWEGEPGTLIEALIGAKFVDRHPQFRIVIHSWFEHCPGYIKKRVERKWGGDPLQIKDLGKRMDSMASQRRPSGANGRLTHPNPTIPNPTQPNTEDSSDFKLQTEPAKVELIPKGLTEICEWWNGLHREHLVNSAVHVATPSEGVRNGWKRLQRLPKLLAILRADRPRITQAIRESQFCRESWFRLERLLGGKNQDRAFILEVLLEGGYRGSAKEQGNRLTFAGLQGGPDDGSL